MPKGLYNLSNRWEKSLLMCLFEEVEWGGGGEIGVRITLLSSNLIFPISSLSKLSFERAMHRCDVAKTSTTLRISNEANVQATTAHKPFSAAKTTTKGKKVAGNFITLL